MKALEQMLTHLSEAFIEEVQNPDVCRTKHEQNSTLKNFQGFAFLHYFVIPSLAYPDFLEEKNQFREESLHNFRRPSLSILKSKFSFK
jgi:hypothetical protein